MMSLNNLSGMESKSHHWWIKSMQVQVPISSSLLPLPSSQICNNSPSSMPLVGTRKVLFWLANSNLGRDCFSNSNSWAHASTTFNDIFLWLCFQGLGHYSIRYSGIRHIGRTDVDSNPLFRYLQYESSVKPCISGLSQSNSECRFDLGHLRENYFA